MSYANILDEVREKVPIITKHHQHSLEINITADIPDWLKNDLPIFGTEESDVKVYNSGGRSVIVEREGQTFRLKGVDPFGAITRKVAASPKLLVVDTKESVKRIPKLPDISSGRYIQFPSYSDGPFGFVSYTKAENAQRAFDAVCKAYEKNGFWKPCEYVGKVIYQKITWRGEYVTTLIFRIPSQESDLREEELERLLIRHLKHASVKQLEELKDPLTELYHKLISWLAFDYRVLFDAHLIPDPRSMLPQNHIITHIQDGKIGISRVDHTSTQHITNLDEEKARKYFKKWAGLLLNFPANILLALDLHRDGGELDTQRYTNWYDAASKFREAFAENYQAVRLIHDGFDAFDEAFENPRPEPINENLLTDLHQAITAIGIDEDRTAKVRKWQLDMIRKAGLPEDPATLCDVLAPFFGILHKL